MKQALTVLVCCVFVGGSSSAQTITTVAGSGAYGNSGYGGPATAASMWDILGVAVDLQGNLFISCGNDPNHISVVKKVTPTGIITRFAGNGVTGFSGDGGPATAANLGAPAGFAFDKKGNVYIADMYANCRVRKVDTAGIITTFAGNGSVTVSGDGGPATAAGISGGRSICFDTVGNLFIAGAGLIRKVDTNGIITTIAGVTGSAPLGDGGPATAAKFNSPGQIIFDRKGNLYICDYGNNRVRKINTAGIVTTIAGTGIVGSSGDGGPATAARLYSPNGVVVDDCDNVYFSDQFNHRIRVINGSGFIKNFAGTGIQGYSGDGGPASVAKFYWPDMMWMTPDGSIYIADKENLVVRRIQMSGCVNTTGTSPQPSPEEREQLHLWPNPAQYELNIECDPSAYQYLTITNSIGQMMKQEQVKTSTTQVNVRMLPRGVYYLSLRGKGGIRTEKVVKE